MELELAGRVALVTGGSRGLGRAIANTLADEGCRVVINGRDAESAKTAATTIGRDALAVTGDVTQLEDCARIVTETVSRCGQLDILVCNVGSGRSVPPGQETPEEWARVLSLNLLATTNMVSAAIESLSRTGGSIVCISSICGIEALGAPVTYSAAKAALNAYVRGVARPLAVRGIRINAIAPGNLLFPGSVWANRVAQDEPAVAALLTREVAQARLGTPEEIASWVAFLASARASFATGALFVVDGGQLRS